MAATSPSCLPTTSRCSPSSAMAAKMPVSAEPGLVNRYSTPASLRVWRSSIPPVPVMVFRMVSLALAPGGRTAPASGGGGLQVVELTADAGDHRGQVRGEHDEVEAALHRARGEGRARAVHARLDAVLVRRIADLVAGGHVQGVGLVGPGGEAEREGEISGADVDGIEPRRGADRIEIGDSFLGFDH